MSKEREKRFLFVRTTNDWVHCMQIYMTCKCKTRRNAMQNPIVNLDKRNLCHCFHSRYKLEAVANEMKKSPIGLRRRKKMPLCTANAILIFERILTFSIHTHSMIIHKNVQRSEKSNLQNLIQWQKLLFLQNTYIFRSHRNPFSISYV